jgi:hypothetical protein
LTNTAYFFLEFAFILVEDNAFRLLVFDGGEKYLVDKRYTSEKGAKISFLNFFGHKYYTDNPIAIWDPPYSPDEDWIQEKLAFIDSLPDEYKQKKVRGKRVSFLMNPGLFALDYAFILDIKTGCRLIVHDLNEKILFDDIYKNVGGAKMAFRIMYGHKPGSNMHEPVWGPFSQPVESWLKKTDRFIASRSPEYIKRRKRK